MPAYKVTVFEVSSYQVEIEAADKDDARAKVVSNRNKDKDIERTFEYIEDDDKWFVEELD